MAFTNNRNSGDNGGGNYNNRQGTGGYPQRGQRGQRGQQSGGNSGPRINWKDYRIGGMYWNKQGNGFNGRVTIDGVVTKIVIFENSLKQEGETTPDYNIHIAPDNGETQGNNQARQAPPARRPVQQQGVRPSRGGNNRPVQQRRQPEYQEPVTEQQDDQGPDFQEGDGPQVDQNADF